MEELIELFNSYEKLPEYTSLVDKLNCVLESNQRLSNSVTIDLVDNDFANEINLIVKNGVVEVFFGKSLRDMKIVLPDEVRLRSHEIFIQFTPLKKLIITNVNLPHSPIQNAEYRCLNDIIEAFSKYINDLTRYFDELEHIDQWCTIMEPNKASFKDDFRRIFLDDRTWLHVEVTLEGLASNVHLVGQSVYWHNKLQSGLLIWDHDKNIVENIMNIFDLSTFPKPSSSKMEVNHENKIDEPLVCGICLCEELLEAPGVPQPLCQNATCGVYYHRSCLYQWLVACAGSRPPAFGVANGACPTCLQPITCSEKDN